MKRFGAMVVLYHPDQRAMRHIERYRKIFPKIFVYDNTPGHCIGYQCIADAQATYCSDGKNNGMSAALAQGFRWAKEQRLDFLLTMDQDSEFGSRDIAGMISYIQKDSQQDTAVYCPNYSKVYVHKKSGAKACTPPKLRAFETKYVGCCMTSGSFVDVRKVQECLPLDDLFIGMVDYDICYMLRLKGYQIRMVGKAVLYQHVGEAVASTWANRILHKVALSGKRYYYMGRNLAYLEQKYRGCRDILWQIRIVRLRMLFNLALCEDRKALKYRYWKIGTQQKCPPFRNIG